MRDRLSKGARKHIADLKSWGDTEEAGDFRKIAMDKTWKDQLSKSVEPGSEGLEGYENLGSDVKSALNKWFDIRYKLQTGEISTTQFDQKRNEFSESFDDETLDDPNAKKGFRIINNLTKRS
jgi:hypothetical protein